MGEEYGRLAMKFRHIADETGRLAQLRETAARQREMAAEYHYEEIARRALEHAQTCDRRADELAG